MTKQSQDVQAYVREMFRAVNNEQFRNVKNHHDDLEQTSDQCTNQTLGKFIRTAGLDYLDRLLSLKTDNEVKFVLELPHDEPISMNYEQRQELLANLREHQTECAHCQERTQNDVAFARLFDRAFNLQPQP